MKNADAIFSLSAAGGKKSRLKWRKIYYICVANPDRIKPEDIEEGEMMH